MSDIRHRTLAQLENDVRFNRLMQNTHKLRAEAAEAEIQRRLEPAEEMPPLETDYEPQAVS